MKLLIRLSNNLSLLVMFVLIMSVSLSAKADEYEDRMRWEGVIAELNELHPEMDRISSRTPQQFHNQLQHALDELVYFLREYDGAYRAQYVRLLAEKIAETINWSARERGRDSMTSNIDELQRTLID